MRNCLQQKDFTIMAWWNAWYRVGNKLAEIECMLDSVHILAWFELVEIGLNKCNPLNYTQPGLN